MLFDPRPPCAFLQGSSDLEPVTATVVEVSDAPMSPGSKGTVGMNPPKPCGIIVASRYAQTQSRCTVIWQAANGVEN